MPRKALTLLVSLLALTIGLPAHSAAGSADRFMGVRIMPGGVVVDGTIVYAGEGVVVTPMVTDAFDSCPTGNVCLFSATGWSGNMVQFSSCCAWNDLSTFGFDNTASSWRNRKAVDAQIAMGSGGGGSRLCLNNNDYAGSMPAGWDNVASSIRVRDAGTYC